MPSLRPDVGQDWYERGKNLHDSAKATEDPSARKETYARAIEVLTGYLGQFQNHPNTDAATWYLGESYAATGKAEEAARCYRNIVKRGGKSPFAMVAANRLAVEHYKNKEYAEAAPLYEKMADAATQPADRLKGRYFAAVAYGQVDGRGQEAAANYRKVIADPDPANPFLGQSQLALGLLLVGQEKLEEALPLLDQVAMSRGGPEVRGPAALQAAAVATKLGKHEASEKYLALVLSTPGMEASRPNAQFALMAASYDRKDYAKVVELLGSSTAPAEGELETRRLMLGAKSYFELRKYAEAVELLREVEKRSDRDGDLSFEAGYLRLLAAFRMEGRHDPEQVKAFLDRYRKGHPKDPKIHTALLIRAETLLDAKKTAEAAAVYKDIDESVLSEDNRSSFFYNRARCLSENGDAKGAILSFSEFIKGFPKDEKVPLALFRRAQAYQSGGEPAKALADYDELIARETTDEIKATAYFEAASIAADQEKLEDMDKRYRAFLEKFPRASDARKALAHYRLAWGLVKTDQVAEALPLADTARKLDAKTYAKPAGLMIAMGHYTLQAVDPTCEEVERSIREAYAKQLPEKLVTWAATQAFQAGRFEQAARFFTLVADEKEPARTPKTTWRLLGKSLLATGKPEAALPPINRALAEEEHPALKADSLLDKGKALLALNRPDEALVVAGECQDLRPQGQINTQVRILTGDIYLKKGDANKAAEQYVVVVQLLGDNDPLRPLAMHQLALALAQGGKKGEAEKYRKELKEKYPAWQAP